MTAPIRIIIPGNPVPWARARTRGHIHFTPKKQAIEKGAIQVLAMAAMRGKAPLEGPVRLVAKFVYPFPASWSEKKRRLPESRWKTSRPDSDNLVKIVKDALTGIAYRDDAQVTLTEIAKMYGLNAGTFVTVEALLPDYTEGLDHALDGRQDQRPETAVG